MKLKDRLRSLAKQGQIVSTLAVGSLSANTNATNAETQTSPNSVIETVEKSVSQGRDMASALSPSASGQSVQNILFDKTMWTFDFQRGVDNLVHDFLNATPHQMQSVSEKTETTNSPHVNPHTDLMQLISTPFSQKQEEELRNILNEMDRNALSNELARSRGSLHEQLLALSSGNGHFRQTEFGSNEARTLDVYKGNGGQLDLGTAADILNEVSHFRIYTPLEERRELSRYSIGVRHSGTDVSNDDYLGYLKEHALTTLLPPNVSTLRSIFRTADSLFESDHRSTRLVGGYELDNGGKLTVSFGSVPIMEEFSSRGMAAPNEAHLMRDAFNVDQRVKNAVCFDYISPNGDMHRLGYAESGKSGTIFSYDGSNGEVFYVGSTSALQDKLQVAGGVRASTSLDGFEGFASVRYRPNDRTQGMFEVHGIGTDDPRCVASIQHNTNNWVFGVMAAASREQQAIYGTVEHRDTGWYTAAGAERIERPSGDNQSGWNIAIGKKWTFGGR